MTRRKRTLCTALAVLVVPALFCSLQAADQELTAKGQLKMGNHAYKMEAGKLYLVRVEGQGFQPVVSIRPGYFTNPETLDKGDTFQSYFVPRETRDHRIFIIPNLTDDFGDGPLNYALSIKPLPLAEKPLLEVKEKLIAADPLYKPPDGSPKDTHFKAFSIKMKAKQIYIIDLVRVGGRDLDPMLYLEGPGAKTVAADDDGGADANARIIFMPRREGEHRIIATTVSKAVGDFMLTVRTEAKE